MKITYRELHEKLSDTAKNVTKITKIHYIDSQKIVCEGDQKQRTLQKMLGTLRETLGTPIMLHHYQVMPGNAGNAKGNTGDANKCYVTATPRREAQGMLREMLGTPITLCHCQVTPGNAAQLIMPGTLETE